MKPRQVVRKCRTCSLVRRFHSDNDDCVDCRRMWKGRQKIAERKRK
jgi:hypothetical protein